MANYFFEPQVYPLMYRNEMIGVFVVDMDLFGKYEYTVEILSSVPPRKIPYGFLDHRDKVISKNRDINHHKAVVLNWVEERVFPEDRQGKREILNKIGTSEYDQLYVLKITRGSSRYDDFWIKFYPEDTFNKTIKERWPYKK